jgi:hypothetical protein
MEFPKIDRLDYRARPSPAQTGRRAAPLRGARGRQAQHQPLDQRQRVVQVALGSSARRRGRRRPAAARRCRRSCGPGARGRPARRRGAGCPPRESSSTSGSARTWRIARRASGENGDAGGSSSVTSRSRGPSSSSEEIPWEDPQTTGEWASITSASTAPMASASWASSSTSETLCSSMGSRSPPPSVSTPPKDDRSVWSRSAASGSGTPSNWTATTFPEGKDQHSAPSGACSCSSSRTREALRERRITSSSRSNRFLGHRARAYIAPHLPRPFCPGLLANFSRS